MRLFLTGPSGYIGSHVLNQALDAGHEVIGLRTSPTRHTFIPLLHEPLWLDKSLEAVEVSDLNGCDVIAHLAAHTKNVPYDTLLNCLHWNLTVPLRLFEQARQAGISSVW